MTHRRARILDIPEPVDGWTDLAACKGMDTAMFYERSVEDLVAVACGQCPVRADCLAEAYLSPEPHGVWGGESERGRKRIRRRMIRGTLDWDAIAAGSLWPDWEPLSPVASNL